MALCKWLVTALNPIEAALPLLSTDLPHMVLTSLP